MPTHYVSWWYGILKELPKMGNNTSIAIVADNPMRLSVNKCIKAEKVEQHKVTLEESIRGDNLMKSMVLVICMITFSFQLQVIYPCTLLLKD